MVNDVAAIDSASASSMESERETDGGDENAFHGLRRMELWDGTGN